ncbi:DNA polymerase-like protein delta subunit 4 [Dendryphion nanum]|uniref:DNA polymerase-like protein delta subunit 4 n=1 Tax=Dendryphion nanum TaxID=256645 RepID=A0A9P9E4I0_9PLEO|nr:DNA polymerase-like protein delta subunit 4 [Dendryphion nanum]
MPPKRRSAGATPKSHQSTLAFHGASNKVTKAGVKAQDPKKKNIDSKVTKPEVVAISPPEELEAEDEPSTAEATVVEQIEKVVSQPTVRTPEDEAARLITDAQIKRYWMGKEKERKAPRVHQKDLGMHEKILREFDMSAQYGPCTGIARLKRWKRAQRLNLSPPMEVLAVLLKEQESSSDKSTVQRSHVDELLSSAVDL